MQERPTEELKLTECGAVVVLYSFLRGGDFREIQKKLARLIEVDPKTGTYETKALSGTVALDHQDIVLDFLLKEVKLEDGKVVEDQKQFIYDLSIADSNQLYDRINELNEKSSLSAEAKKK